MKRLKIIEALKILEKQGKLNNSKKATIETKAADLFAADLWPESNRATQLINTSNLLIGKTKRINIEWISILCEKLNCSLEFLFGTKK